MYGVCCGQNGKFYLFDMDTGDIRAELAGTGFMSAGVVSPDLKTAVGSSWGGGSTLMLYRIPAKQ